MSQHRAPSVLLGIAATGVVLWACTSAETGALTSDPGDALEHDAPSAPAPEAGPPGAPLSSDAGSAPDAKPTWSPGAIRVCPSGCEHTLPSEALAGASDGAVVEILAGDYADCLAIHRNQITIRGVGGRAHLHTKLCDQKGIIVTYGKDARLEHLELSDFTSPDYTGAGIRHDVQASNVTLTDVFVHDGQFGLLASSTGDVVTIEGSLFQHVGVARPDGEVSVPLFVTGAQKLVVRDSRFLEGVGGASMIKSRAKSTVIACSVIANLDGPDSYSIDLQTGNDFSLTNSVVEQSASTQNKIVIAYGSVSFDPAAATSFTMKGNTLLNDVSGGTFVNLFRGAPSTFDVSGNTFIGGGTVLAGGGTLGANQELAARPAQLGSYPKLPAPGPCN